MFRRIASVVAPAMIEMTNENPASAGSSSNGASGGVSATCIANASVGTHSHVMMASIVRVRYAGVIIMSGSPLRRRFASRSARTEGQLGTISSSTAGCMPTREASVPAMRHSKIAMHG